MVCQRQVLAAMAVTVAACNPTYAPPVRSTHYGAPGRLGFGQGEVTVAGSLQGAGTATVSLPLTRTVRVELSGDGSEKWVMGSAGVRATFAPQGNGTVADLEAGGGGGVGGELCGNQSTRQTNCDGAGTYWDGAGAFQRPAVGAYLGAGLGRRWGVFTVFARGRMQASMATDVPATFWWSSLAGAEVRLGPVNAWLGAGIAGYVNRVDSNHGLVLEGGLAVPFTVR